ncbi:MAG: TRAP transporter small permease subunit, partial [Pseudomonadota bacterium]
LIVVAQLCVVILRYVFGLSFSWLSEIVVYGFAAMFLLASASALRDDDHVRVDILRPQFGVKGRAGVELAGTYLLLFPICMLILWSAISPSFVRSWMNFEASRESDGLPILFLFRTLVPLFAVLVAAQGLSQAIKAAQILTGQRQPPEQHTVAAA